MKTQPAAHNHFDNFLILRFKTKHFYTAYNNKQSPRPIGEKKKIPYKYSECCNYLSFQLRNTKYFVFTLINFNCNSK